MIILPILQPTMISKVMVTIRHGDRDRDDKDNDGDDGDGDANHDADADDADGDGDADDNDGGKEDGDKCAMRSSFSSPTPCMTFSSIELGDSTCTATLLEAIGGSHWIGLYRSLPPSEAQANVQVTPRINFYLEYRRSKKKHRSTWDGEAVKVRTFSIIPGWWFQPI